MRAERPILWLLALAVAVTPAACRFSEPGGSAGDDAGPKIDAAIDAAEIDAPPDGPRTDWWDANWKRRRRITVDTTKLTGTVDNFPLLVRLPQSAVDLNGAHSDELRFIAVNGANYVVLNYELDTVVVTDPSYVWVRIPRLMQNGQAPSLWLYYDRPGIGALSNPAAVFGDYVSVHHLGPSTGLNLPDASGKSHTASATSNNEMPQLTNSGRVGQARDFNGSTDFLQLATESDYDFTTSLTVSAWIRRSAFTTAYQAIVCKGDKTWRMHRENQTQFAGFGTTDNNNNNDNLSGSFNIDDNNWHHVAITYSGGTKKLYVDGALDRMTNANQINTDNTPVQFGHNSNSQSNPDRYWNGAIDEVRITNTAYDAAWIKAEYLTVADQTFVMLGAEERF